MRLAKFIGVMAKPENEAKEAIAMTAPVLMSRANDSSSASTPDAGAYKMAFFLPASRYTRAADAPKPTSPHVALVDVPARTVAAVTFSGTMRAPLIAEKERELRDALGRDGIKTPEGAEAGLSTHKTFTPYLSALTRIFYRLPPVKTRIHLINP